MVACGLDFGTSNSTIGLAQGNRTALVPLEGDSLTLPSALFFDSMTGQRRFGRAAIEAYVAGDAGRFMRSIKSVLGTNLIDEETQIGRSRIAFRSVLAILIEHIKSTAEAKTGRSIQSVVHGRPVHFVDGDPEADARAEAALAEVARSVGFKDISFQYEPIAAALHYETEIDREEIALIADIGGGTSDFSLVRLAPARMQRPDRADDILANTGLRLGGTDVDRLLSLETIMPVLGFRAPLKRKGLLAPNRLFHDLATWATINFLYNQQTRAEVRDLKREAVTPILFERLETVLSEELGHSLALEAEAAKLALSGQDNANIDLALIEPGLLVPATRLDLQRAFQAEAARLSRAVRHCLQMAGLSASTVTSVFMTGGSTLLPEVRTAILGEVPDARVVEGDKFGAVGLGLTIEAIRRYG